MVILDPIAAIRARLKTCTQVELAAEMKVSPTFLCNVLRGNRTASPKMLKILGLEKRITYHVNVSPKPHPGPKRKLPPGAPSRQWNYRGHVPK
jgi:transcriptional regulator with XRE-family HTH domain